MLKNKVATGAITALITALSFVTACTQTSPTLSTSRTPSVSPTPTPPVTSPTSAESTILAVTTEALGNGTVGVAYSQRLQAAGGSGTYSWAISGGTLPAGLNLGSDVISGTPTASGAFSFTVQVSDAAGETAAANLSINVQRVTPIITTATLPGGKVGTAYSQALAATDGVLPYTWVVTDGILPGGLALNSGTIAGTPTASGSFSFTVQVTDSAGSTAKSSLSINIASVPVVTTTTLASGEIGVAYSQTLAASGGSPPYTWSITSGALPAGLALNAGVISGNATATGTFSVGIQATDSSGVTATASLSIAIAPLPSVTVSSLPAGRVGTAYLQSLTATGGLPPYTWSIISGSLPGGLGLNAGVISGTPTTAGTFSFTAQITDSASASASAVIYMSITTAPTITTTALLGGEVGVAYSQNVTVSGGLPPYAWSITTGVLPAGLALGAGTIGGNPTAGGSYAFTLQVADSSNATASASLSINIATVPIITSSSLASGKVGTTYSQNLTAAGGTTPYAWSISSGSLPGGLSLNGGTISGTPTAAGTFNFAVQVTDAAGVTITANLSLTVTSS